MINCLLWEIVDWEFSHKDSLGYIEASCDGCMVGIAVMYQDYIDGKRELKDINMSFSAGYVLGDRDRGK